MFLKIKNYSTNSFDDLLFLPALTRGKTRSVTFLPYLHNEKKQKPKQSRTPGGGQPGRRPGGRDADGDPERDAGTPAGTPAGMPGRRPGCRDA